MPAATDLKVLVVDDQQTIRSLVRNGLRDIGVTTIEEAADGEDALGALLTKRINLIISDFNMPRLDGLGLLRAVRMTPQLKGIAFIMLTGRADADLVARAQQFGVNNYLVKPFTVSSLRSKIEEVFGALT
ncbi:MAG: response regulator [Alphaproteobacteria bacterium]|jgi:two-component system, chemotaxis family, chemotaxis protein CheY|nr:response regulator [Alphaproteobacteria bacterium]MBU2040648.1 response regulator [Alphaproteobacteria bacterium]MBU2125669.1 response regulator [Alphaproteobacteria bacterium]MBU2209076.1 response regulator [Alphaproteobacteria bacterium]MBU2289879.1 response regulator [Alphaproteobacteria bacterium]